MGRSDRRVGEEKNQIDQHKIAEDGKACHDRHTRTRSTQRQFLQRDEQVAIGRLLSLDLPELLFLMRFLGLVVFTAMTAYAIAVTPTLQWAFVLIAMLPVSLDNRVVLSADGAALSYALVITALCFRAAWNPSDGRVWERSLWMTV